jgi:hypothetical protein
VTALLVLLVGGLCVPGVVLLARFWDIRYWREHLTAYDVRWPGGLEVTAVQQWLANVAAMTHPARWSLLPLPPVALEVEATSRGVRHRLLLPSSRAEQLLAGLRAAVPGVRITEDAAYLEARRAFRVAAELRLNTHTRPLGFARAEGASAALLASLQPISGHAEAVRVQWIFTSAGTPAPVHTASPKQADAWWSGYLLDDSLPADAEAVQALRLKQRSPLLAATARLAVAAPTRARAYALFGRSWGSFHGLNASGVRLLRRWLPSAVVARRMAVRSYPAGRWPLTMNTDELSGLLGLPIGGVALPGVVVGTARQLPPSSDMPTSGTIIAKSNYPGMENRLLTVRVEDRLRHTLAVGPTGSGKSWLLTQMILQDIAAGRGVFAVDMKGDLIHDIISRVSETDAERLVVVDPSQRHLPVGLNILGGGHDEASRELVVDNTLHVFKELWAAYWGPRSDQIMRAALQTLVSTCAADGSAFTLVELVPLLTNPTFRRFVVAQRGLPESARVYWQRYDAMTENERANAIAPILNKIDAFTGRTAIRLLLGQSNGLDLRDIFRKRSVVLVNLAKGVHGSETSNLVGALLVLKLWQATLERVQVPAEQRHPVMAYIDEAQDVMRLPVPLADVFSQARGLGLGLTVAHQYFAQLPEHIKAAELGTVRTQILFATEYEDAKLLEQRFSPLTADDLMGLEAYEVAARLCVGGRTVAPATGLTLPLAEPLRDAATVLDASQQRYGKPRTAVEAAIAARIVVPSQTGRGRFGREASRGEA